MNTALKLLAQARPHVPHCPGGVSRHPPGLHQCVRAALPELFVSRELSVVSVDDVALQAPAASTHASPSASVGKRARISFFV